MLNNHLPERLPGPGCGFLVDLLPLLDEELLHEPEASQVRAHVAGCAYCQQQRAAYSRIDANLRRHFGGLPPLRLSPEDTMSAFEDDQRPEGAPSAAPAPLHRTPERRTQRFVSVFSAVAAALIIVVVVTALIASRGTLSKHPGTSHAVLSSPTPTAMPVPEEVPYVPDLKNDTLSAVQMVSSTQGWAVGARYAPSTGSAESASEVLILHDNNGQWVRMQAPSKEELGLHDPELAGIAMVSADEGWAVGNGGFAGPALPSAFMLHYSGGKWTRLSASLIPSSIRCRCFRPAMAGLLAPDDGRVARAG